MGSSLVASTVAVTGALELPLSGVGAVGLGCVAGAVSAVLLALLHVSYTAVHARHKAVQVSVCTIYTY